MHILVSGIIRRFSWSSQACNPGCNEIKCYDKLLLVVSLFCLLCFLFCFFFYPLPLSSSPHVLSVIPLLCFILVNIIYTICSLGNNSYILLVPNISIELLSFCYNDIDLEQTFIYNCIYFTVGVWILLC